MKTQGSPPLVRERRFSVEDGEYTQFRVYDISNEKEPIIGSTSTDSHSNEVTPPWPVPTIGSNISIRDFLQNVNDNLGKPYINSDGTPNYGIYFGDNKTGGVMYIGDHPRSCGKDALVLKMENIPNLEFMIYQMKKNQSLAVPPRIHTLMR